MAEFCMPALGADMEAGTVIEWRVKPGDAVKRGDIVAVVDTEKATIEVEIFQTGVVQSIVVPEGEKVPVGAVLALIQSDGEVATPPSEPKPAPAPSPVQVPKKPVRPTPPPAPAAVERLSMPRRPAAEHPRLRISPLAMRVAVELGVDVSTVEGTGLDGAITKADVERAAKDAARERPPAPPPPSAAAPVTAPAAAVTPGVTSPKAAGRPKPAVAPAERQAAMRKVIAAAMGRSKREIPHYYLATHIDMSRAMDWLQGENLTRPVTARMLYSVLLMKAVAIAVHEVPEMNGFCVDGVFKPAGDVHVGVAIALRQGGLIAPAIHDLDKKSPDEIMSALRDLVKRARAGVLRSSEIADATITVTSLGEEGVETVFGIIYPPQVALVGFGRVIERPWAAGGMIGVKPVIKATLSADHRASDGHRGAIFLAAIDRFLQEPEKL